MANIAFFFTTTVLVATGSLVAAMPYSASVIAGLLSDAPGNYTSAPGNYTSDPGNTTGSLVAAIPYSNADITRLLSDAPGNYTSDTVNTTNKAVHFGLLGTVLESIFLTPVVWVARFLRAIYMLY